MSIGKSVLGNRTGCTALQRATMVAATGCSAVWQRTCFGSRGSPVQIRPARRGGRSPRSVRAESSARTRLPQAGCFLFASGLCVVLVVGRVCCGLVAGFRGSNPASPTRWEKSPQCSSRIVGSNPLPQAGCFLFASGLCVVLVVGRVCCGLVAGFRGSNPASPTRSGTRPKQT